MVKIATVPCPLPAVLTRPGRVVIGPLVAAGVILTTGRAAAELVVLAPEVPALPLFAVPVEDDGVTDAEPLALAVPAAVPAEPDAVSPVVGVAVTVPVAVPAEVAPDDVCPAVDPVVVEVDVSGPEPVVADVVVGSPVAADPVLPGVWSAVDRL